MTGERRQTEGVVVVTTTERALCVKQRFLATGVPVSVLPVQDGPAWPQLRPPLVLDTIGMPVEMLVVLLADPARVTSMPKEQSERVPMAALADPSDWRTLRLLILCPAVRLISADDLLSVRWWVRHLSSALPPRRPASQPACLFAPPLPLPTPSNVEPASAQSVLRDPFLLPLLAALLNCSTYAASAAWCHVSDSTLFRTLRELRATLGLPSGDVSRLAPADLAHLILERLSADSPLASQQARQGCDHDSHEM
jgi:hypothetical protein